MTAKSKDSKTAWVDPDDAPELTGDELDHPQGVWRRGEEVISAEEGKAEFRKRLSKKQVNMLLDQDIIDYFKTKAGGRGYQTLINDTLRTAMEGERLEDTLRRVIREELRREETEDA